MASPRHEPEPAFFDEDEEEVSSQYQLVDKLGEGTYGTVYRAVCRETNERVAIKRIRILYEDDGVPSTALREISILKNLDHINVVKLHNVFSSRMNLHLVFECLDMDLRKYLKDCGPMRDHMLRSASYQLVRGVEFCHGRSVLHRDLKPQNVLIDVRNMRLVLADFGLARSFSVPLKVYTHEVVTLWYRPPEILLGQVKYGPSADVWSLGCIVGEMATRQALFPGDSEIDTLFKIFKMLGTPNDEVWPGVSTLKDYKTKFPQWKDSNFVDLKEFVIVDNHGQALLDNYGRPFKAGQNLGEAGMDFLRHCLKYNHVDRPSAMRLLTHPFLQDNSYVI